MKDTYTLEVEAYEVIVDSLVNGQMKQAVEQVTGDWAKHPKQLAIRLAQTTWQLSKDGQEHLAFELMASFQAWAD